MSAKQLFDLQTNDKKKNVQLVHVTASGTLRISLSKCNFPNAGLVK